MEGIQKIINNKASLNKGLCAATVNLKEAFPNTTPEKRGRKKNKNYRFLSWMNKWVLYGGNLTFSLL